jgi:uncharacterized protein YjbI with pentapeptide repeats
MADDQLVTWESCRHNECIGIRLATTDWCLAHAASQDSSAFDAELKRIGTDGTIDARGVHLTAKLLQRLLEALPHQDDRPVLRAAEFKLATFQCGMRFDEAIFLGETGFWGATFQSWIGFRRVTFEGDAIFMSARFQGEALFDEATFQGDAAFDTARFEDKAVFDGATFRQTAAFSWAKFHHEAAFNQVLFEGYTEFNKPTFHDRADFNRAIFQRDTSVLLGASFEGTADFGNVAFEQTHQVGPLAARRLVLDGAVFSQRVQLEALVTDPWVG